MTWDGMERRLMKKDSIEGAVKAIATAAEAAIKTIAQAAGEARTVITHEAQIKSLESATDHDLLIKLDTKVDQIQLDVTTLKNQETLYVNQTEHKVVCDKQGDHEIRLRVIERYGSIAIGVLFVIEFLFKYFIK